MQFWMNAIYHIWYEIVQPTCWVHVVSERGLIAESLARINKIAVDWGPKNIPFSLRLDSCPCDSWHFPRFWLIEGCNQKQSLGNVAAKDPSLKLKSCVKCCIILYQQWLCGSIWSISFYSWTISIWIHVVYLRTSREYCMHKTENNINLNVTTTKVSVSSAQVLSSSPPLG